MYFKPIVCLWLLIGLWSYQATAQTQNQTKKPRHVSISFLKLKTNWALSPAQSIKFAKIQIIPDKLSSKTPGTGNKSTFQPPTEKIQQLGEQPQQLKAQVQQKLGKLKGKADRATQVPHQLLNKTQKVITTPQKLTNTLQQKRQQMQGTPKKLSQQLKQKLGKLQAAQKLVNDLETRTGGKLDQWTQKLTVPEMRQLQEARQLLKGADAKLQKLIPENLTNHRVFQDMNKWTRLEGLNLDQLKGLEALQSLQKLQNLGSLGNLKGLSVLGKYGTQAQNLVSPYAKQFSLMQKLTQQYRGKFPGNLTPSALAPDVKQFLGQHQDKLKAAQEKLASLKQCYQSIASIQTLDSGALKRKSLKGQGHKRFILGGKFEIASYAPFSLDLAPRMGYRLDKNLSLGVMAGYRKTWGDLQNISLLPESFHYAGFINYELVRAFYAYTEIGQNQVAPVPGAEQEAPRWARTFLVGVGKSIRLGNKMSLQTLLLYNFWHDPLQAVYPQRWVFRFGVQWDWQKP
ncbi:MAG TPA: hypothetical protein DCS93_28215 [Microscillaceae bacterium]|nr:hypothetical protein [Microscillaceae bacterium]